MAITYKTVIAQAIAHFNDVQTALAGLGAKDLSGVTIQAQSAGFDALPTDDLDSIISEQLQLKASGNIKLTQSTTTDVASYATATVSTGAVTVASPTLSPTITSLTFGTLASGKYAVTGTSTKTAAVGATVTAGWVTAATNGTATANAAISFDVPRATFSQEGATIKVSTAGYIKAEETAITVGAGTVVVSNKTLEPAITTITVGASSAGYYPITGAANTSATVGAAVTAGYVTTATAGTFSANATLNASIAAATFSVAGSDVTVSTAGYIGKDTIVGTVASGTYTLKGTAATATVGTLTFTASGSSKYTVTGNNTATAYAATDSFTAGWIASSAASKGFTITGAVNATIDKATFAAKGNQVSVTKTGYIVAGTDASPNYIATVGNATIASVGTKTTNAYVTPGVTNTDAMATGSDGTAGTTYFRVTPTIAGSANGNVKAGYNTTAAGWVTAGEVAGNVAVGVSASTGTAINIKRAFWETSTTAPGTGWTNVVYTTYSTSTTTFSLAAGGVLKINAGYIPSTYITLGQLIADVGSNPATSQIVAGYKVYDDEGNVITGTAATITPAATYYTATNTGYGKLEAGFLTGTSYIKAGAFTNAAAASLDKTSFKPVIAAASTAISSCTNIYDAITTSTTKPGSGYVIQLGAAGTTATATATATNTGFTAGWIAAPKAESTSTKTFTVSAADTTYITVTAAGTGANASGSFAVTTAGYIPTGVLVNKTTPTVDGNSITVPAGYLATQWSSTITAGTLQASGQYVSVKTAGYLAAGASASVVSVALSTTYASTTSSGGYTTYDAITTAGWAAHAYIKAGSMTVGGGALTLTNSTTGTTTNKGNVIISTTEPTGDYVKVVANRAAVTTGTETAGWVSTVGGKPGATTSTAYIPANTITASYVTPTVTASANSPTVGTATTFNSSTGVATAGTKTATTTANATCASATKTVAGQKYLISNVTVGVSAAISATQATGTATIAADACGSGVDSYVESLWKRILGLDYTDVTADA